MSTRYVLITLAITLALTSCFKDHSRGADIAISELTAKGELQEIYRKEQGMTLTIPVSYTHLTLPTILRSCRSRWSPYH